MLSFNSIVPHLSIRAKLLIAFVGLSIIPVIFVGVYGIYSNVSTLQNFAFENLSHDVRTIRVQAATFLSSVEGDLLLLRSTGSMRDLVAELGTGNNAPAPLTRDDVCSDILSFAKTKGIYYRLSIISEQREELVRIQRDTISGSAPRYNPVPPGQSGGGNELYFYLAQNLEPDQVEFAPAEMIYRNSGQIPVVNFILPLASNGKRVGLLVASVLADRLFDVMQSQRNLGVLEKVVLVEGDGHYLYSSEYRQRWDQLIAFRSVRNLNDEYSPAVVDSILSGQSGTLSEGTDDIIAFAPLFPEGDAHASVIPHPTSFAEPLFLFESVPKSTVLGPTRTFGWTFAGFILVFLAGAVLLGLLATQQFTRPIQEVTRSADTISRGNYAHRLDVRTGDEIQQLAAQFNLMAASLEIHEREIREHHLRLEEMVQERTRQFVDEKSKLQAILDIVPSAFVLLDREYRILTTSAAFRAISGVPQADVRGLDSRELFTRIGLCSRFPGLRAAGVNRIDNHIDQLTDAGGTVRFIEHITIPVVEDGALRSFVMIMTDITQRKRLEEHLIQSEKLMATGELSAIIAHEFRNALTSIKMILQLQQESASGSAEDRQALGVALDSIFHMESIVKELLNFARPSPMEFQTRDIREILNESMGFAQLRIQRRQIRLRMDIPYRLPPVRVDAPRIKEAVINLLINGIQAIEDAPDEKTGKEISIYARGVRLQRTLRDFAPSPLSENSDSAEENGGREVVLRKGTVCLLVGVRDSGPGIDPALLQRIFDPFFTTKTNGTGLGLPMVKRTLNAHGGIVIVKSAPNAGATFEILLPVQSNGQGGQSIEPYPVEQI